MKLVDTPTLKRLVEKARQRAFSRLLDPAVEEALDPAGFHVSDLISAERDAGGEPLVTCAVEIKIVGTEVPVRALLDFDLVQYDDLPTFPGIAESVTVLHPIPPLETT